MAWRLRIKHVTGFTYAGTAHASYNEARMTPVTAPGQTTLFSQVECLPGATTWRYRDYWGTQVTVFDLQRPHQQLKVTASSLVETADRAPVEATVGWDAVRSGAVADAYAEAKAATPLTAVDDELIGQATELAGDLPPDQAARAIADWVRSNVEYQPGSTGVRTSAQEAWSLRQGSARTSRT